MITNTILRCTVKAASDSSTSERRGLWASDWTRRVTCCYHLSTCHGECPSLTTELRLCCDMMCCAVQFSAMWCCNVPCDWFAVVYCVLILRLVWSVLLYNVLSLTVSPPAQARAPHSRKYMYPLHATWGSIHTEQCHVSHTLTLHLLSHHFAISSHVSKYYL